MVAKTMHGTIPLNDYLKAGAAKRGEGGLKPTPRQSAKRGLSPPPSN